MLKNKVATEIGLNKRIGIATSLELKIQEKNRTENSIFSRNINEKLILKDIQIPVTKAELLNLAQQSKRFTQIKSIESTSKKETVPRPEVSSPLHSAIRVKSLKGTELEHRSKDKNVGRTRGWEGTKHTRP